MAAASAGGSVCPRTKPEIYSTSDGKIIVEDELLNFIVVKMKTLSHDEIVNLVSNNFSSEWIEESKRLLFDVCPKTSQRCVMHKGPQKDINNVKACLKLLNECGENTPRFVSHHLDQLPPVGFGHMDASALLSRMERLKQEVAGLRIAVESQATVSESLSATSATLDRRITNMERRADVASATTEQRNRGTADRADVVDTGVARAASCAEEPAGELTRPPPPPPQSPQWATVVRNGLKKTAPRYGDELPKPKQVHRKREPKNTGIMGTGTVSKIPVITTKLVSVFATRFAPSLEADTLRDYLVEKLGNESVTCRKIETAHSRFGSFHVTAECVNIDDVYNPEIWPAGTYIRRYYDARGRKATESAYPAGNAAVSVSV